MSRAEVITVWTNLKAKIIKSLTEAKNMLNKQVVVKSVPTQIKILTSTGLTNLQEKIKAKQALIKEIENKRKPKQLFSKDQQEQLDCLKAEVASLEQQIREQQYFTETALPDLLRTKTDLASVRLERDDYWQRLKVANNKHDLLQDKLKLVKRLIAKGDMESLLRMAKRREI